jgi:uncharacterized protein (DUF305 family)
MTLQRQMLKDQLAVVEAPTDADVGFLRDMMTHHEQAIELSLIEVSRGADPQVRQQASDILLAQRGEYVQMSDKLDAWGLDSVSPDGKAMAWMGMPVAPEAMPGLATPAEMAAFKAMRGNDADVEFLRLMTVHHGSGVEMAKYAGDRTEIGLVGVLSTRMIADQQSEINDMRNYGKRLGVDIPAPKAMESMPPMAGMSHGSDAGPGTTKMDHSNHNG